MPVTYYHIDAFVIPGEPFSGNPAAIVVLDEWPEDEELQAMAAQHNLSETAFFLRREAEVAAVDAGPEAEDAPPTIRLRWFTPSVEVDLCGHATLAAAHAILHEMDAGGDAPATALHFETESGPLLVRHHGDRLSLDLPARPAAPCGHDDEVAWYLAAGLGGKPRAMLKSPRDWMLLYGTAEEVRLLRPNYHLLPPTPGSGIIVTAPGDVPEVDYVCRFFAPGLGINEDPVTGSAQCTLIPYWAKERHRPHVSCRQLSARGGDLEGELHGERVRVAGACRTYLRGTIKQVG